MSQKKILITGVTGMDGSNMVDYLLANTDHLVYGMVRRLSVPNHKNLEQALKNPRFKLVSGDLGDQYSLDCLMQQLKPDYFFNFAAQSFVAESWNTPENTVNINTIGVVRCLEAVRRFNPTCRFYSAGSSEEWGDVQYSPQDMAHPIRPRSPYGASKAGARHFVKVYRESYNLYAIHGILFNHEGLRRGEEFVTRKITKGVARIYHAIQQGLNSRQPKPLDFEPIELGNLDAQRDWSDSEDFVQGVWRIMNQEQYREDLKGVPYSKGSILLPFEVEKKNVEVLSPLLKEYILSSNETHTVRSFVEKAFKAAGIDGSWGIKLNGDPESETYEWIINKPGQRIPQFTGKKLVVINPKFYRPAEVDLLIGDSTPARTELGWQPKISFDQLVQRMVENDIQNYGR